MPKPQPKRNKPTTKHATKLLKGGLSAFLLLGPISCTTPCKQHQQIVSVSISQVQLIKHLKAQRKIPELTAAIQKDSTLSRSESDLQAGLDALMRSSQAIKESLSSKPKGE